MTGPGDKNDDDDLTRDTPVLPSDPGAAPSPGAADPVFPDDDDPWATMPPLDPEPAPQAVPVPDPSRPPAPDPGAPHLLDQPVEDKAAPLPAETPPSPVLDHPSQPPAGEVPQEEAQKSSAPQAFDTEARDPSMPPVPDELLSPSAQEETSAPATQPPDPSLPPDVDGSAATPDPSVPPASAPEPAAPEPVEDDDRTMIATEAPSIPPTTLPPDAAPAAPEADAGDDRTMIASEPPVIPPTTLPPETDSAAPGIEPGEVDDRTMVATEVPVAPAPDASSIPSAAEAFAGPALTQPAQVGIGTLINNNYKITEVLKSGGMGEVYRGENVFTTDKVAIKVVLPELAEDEKVGLMFKREARTLSQLSDEAIVRYHNFVHDPAINRYCLIMEFISGVPLSDHTHEDGPISVPAALRLISRLAKGLEKAHKLGVIHRDLSPDNVMLPHGNVDEAVLIDFGIAKSNVVKEGTMAGQFAGKFKYVAPEQLGGFGGEVGPVTDIYGLALLIAAAVVGHPLDMGASIVEAVKARESIPDLEPVPKDLRPLLAFMLEPDPAARPASMAEVQRLVDNPALVPIQYGTMAPRGGTNSGIAMPPVPGLQQPGGTTRAGLTQAPQTQAGVTLTPSEPAGRRGGGMLALLSVVALAVIGGAGWWVWDQGLIGPGSTGGNGTGGEQTAGTDTPAPVPGTLPEPNPQTREGFLALFDAGPCTYATRISIGANAGLIQGFATHPGAFDGLPTAYEEKFGARPTVLDRVLTPQQCAAIEFARDFEGRSADPIALAMDADVLDSGASLNGTVVDGQGRQIWLALISPQGKVYNLSAQLGPSEGGRRSFRFGLKLPDRTDTAGQILMAVATDTPLAAAAIAAPRSDGAELFPRIAEELKAKGGGDVAATFLLVRQPPPPPPPEPPAEDANSAPAADGGTVADGAATDGTSTDGDSGGAAPATDGETQPAGD